jgi:hypothetical protein
MKGKRGIVADESILLCDWRERERMHAVWRHISGTS